MVDVYQARALDLFERFVKAYEQKDATGEEENTNRAYEAGEVRSLKDALKWLTMAVSYVAEPDLEKVSLCLASAMGMLQVLIHKHEGALK